MFVERRLQEHGRKVEVSLFKSVNDIQTAHDRDHVHASTAYTADDGASRSCRANVQTGAILPLPRRRRDRSPGNIR